MRTKLACATLMLALGSGPVFAQSGEITIWSWNIAASSLKATVAGFNKQFPDVKVTVEDLGNQQTFDKTLAGCAAGGAGLPDILSIENHESEIFWSQFPDCFVDLTTLGYTDEIAANFPTSSGPNSRSTASAMRCRGIPVRSPCSTAETTTKKPALTR